MSVCISEAEEKIIYDIFYNTCHEEMTEFPLIISNAIDHASDKIENDPRLKSVNDNISPEASDEVFEETLNRIKSIVSCAIKSAMNDLVKSFEEAEDGSNA